MEPTQASVAANAPNPDLNKTALTRQFNRGHAERRCATARQWCELVNRSLHRTCDAGTEHEVIASLNHETRVVKNYFLNRGDHIGLEIFFEQALLIYSPEDTYEKLRIDNIRLFEYGLQRAFDELRGQLDRQPKSQVVVFEYYFDRLDNMGVNDFYLLDQFEPDEFTWYRQGKILDSLVGPAVHPYIQYSTSVKLNAELEYVYKQYVQSVLMAAFVRTLRMAPPFDLPFSFAEQDDSVYVLRP